MEHVHGGFEVVLAGRALAAAVVRLGGKAVRVAHEQARQWHDGDAMVERLNEAKGDALEKMALRGAR